MDGSSSAPRASDAHAPTVGDVIQKYLGQAALKGVHCPQARADRERTLSMFVRACGTLPVAEVRPYHLSDFVEAQATWASDSTRRAKANQVRAAFEWAAEGGRIDRNPFRSVRYPEAERRPDMPDDVLERMASAANKPFERIVRFLRLTACRLSEACNATWDQFDLDRGVWRIEKHKSRKKTGRVKYVALVPEACDLLRVVAGAGADGRLPVAPAAPLACAVPAKATPVFVNNRGTAYNRWTLSQQLRRLKRRCGVATAATLHGIRHRFGTAAIAAGAPLKLVSQQMGHASSVVTEAYYCDLSNEIDAIRDAARLGLPRQGGEGNR